MKNKISKTTVITTIVCLLPVIAGIILYNRLPETIATHWDFQGNPNGYSSRFIGVIVFPGALVLVNLLIPLLLKTDPKYENIGDKIKTLIQWIIPLVCIFCSGFTLSEAFGLESKIEIITPLFVGLIFVLIGNYLPKTRQSYTVGIKLPWTLADEVNWNKTHRMAGFLWIFCGFAIMISAFTPFRQYVLILVLIVSFFVPTIYSYILFLRKKDDNEKSF